MGNFRSVAFPLFIFLIKALPVLLLLALGLVILNVFHSEKSQRRIGLYGLLGLVIFTLVDGLLLAALPWLGLSFGPVLFSLIILFGVRAVLFILWGSVRARAIRRMRRPTPLGQFLFFNALLTAMVVYGFYYEPFNLQVTRIEVPVPARQISQPVRIVQLSDIHIERLTPRERNVIAQVKSLKPDLIALTGDYLNLSYLNDPLAMQEAQTFFSQLSAPYGIYAVSGSVDDDTSYRMQDLFLRSQVTVLDDQAVQVELPGGKLTIIGVTNYGYWRDSKAVRSVTAAVAGDEYRLLLFHTPDEIRTAVESKIDLYLAGHTHGGQIALPFYGAIVTSSAYGKRYEAGRYQVDGTTMYVSRGLGMEGGIAPRARAWAAPEIVVVDLVPTP